MLFMSRMVSIIALGGVLGVQGCKSGIDVETFAGGSALMSACPDGSSSCAFQMVMDAKIINTTSTEMTWTTAPDAVSYALEIARDEACTKRSSLLQLTELTTTIDFLEDGAHYFCLYGVLSDGTKVPAENNGLKVVFDRTPPVVTLDPENNAKAPFSLAPAATDLTKVDYSWEKISGPGDVTISDPLDASAIFSMTQDGRYVLRLTAVDEADNATEKDVVVDWDATAPLVNVGADILTNSFVSVSATVDASAASARWQTMSGPAGSTIAFSAPQNAVTKITADTDGAYVVRLTATDAHGNEGFDELTFTRDTVPPTINIGADITIGNTFTVTPTVTDGVTYQWTKVSGPGTITFSAPTAKNTDITASADGIYVLKLTATDLVGNSASDTMALNWTTTGPAVAAGADKSVNAPALIDATTSGVDQWQWTKVSGPGTVAFSAPTSEDTTVSVSADGTYVLRLTATNTSTSASAFDEVQVFFDTVNPTVNVGADLSAKVPTTVNATAGGTPGTIGSYQWSKTAGPGLITFGTPTADNTSITASADGTYTIQLTVTDVAGNTASDTLNFTWDTTAATVDAGVDRTLNSAQALNATVSGLGAGGTYAWTKMSGPGNVTFTTAADEDPTVSTDADGTYVLQLTATDAVGNAASDTMTLTWDTTAPTVSAGSDVTAKALVLLSGTAGGATSYQWSKVSGPGTLVFGSANAVSSTVQASADGSYVVRLTATDAAGNSASDDLTLIWDTTVPTVDAGVNVIAKTMTTITGTAPTAVSYTWSMSSGPGTLTFGSANALSTSISADTDGTYVVMLSAADAAGNSAADVMTFNWDATAPSVDLGADFTAQNTTNLTPTVSADATTFLWEKVSGPGAITFSAPNAKNTNVSANADGTYVLRLTATDAATNSGNDLVTMTWDTTGPSVNVGADVVTKVMHSITPTVSDDPVGSTYQWTKISGPGTITFGTAAAKNTTASASADGVYVLRLTVTDPANNSASDDLSFEWDTTAPSVNVGIDRLVKTTTTLTGTVVGGATYSWTMQSGPGAITFGSANAVSTTASADTEGAYVIRLTATDAAGNSAYDELNFDWDVSAPTVDAGSDVATRVSTTLTGTSSGGTYAWSKIAGPGVITFGSPTALSTTASASVDGTYVLQLTATDAAGNVASDTMTFTWDTTPPTVNVGADRSVGVSFTIDAVTAGAATYAWSKISGPGTVTFTAPTAEDTDVSIVGDGTHVLRLVATDAVGNTAYDDLTVIWDTSTGSAPTFTSVDLINAAGDGYLNTAERALTSNVVGNLAAANYDAATYAVAASGATCSALGTYGATIPKANAAGFTGDGDYKVCVKLTKTAQSPAYGESDVIHVDTTPPTFTSFPLANDAADAGVNNADVTNNLELAGPLTGTELDHVSYTIRLASQSCSTTTTWGATNPKAGDLAGFVNGSFKVCVKIADDAGNTIYNNSPTFTLDKDAPLFSGVALKATAFNAADVAASSEVVYAATGLNFDDTFYKIVNASVMSCASGVTFDNPANTLPTAADLSALADGSYKVCVKLIDDGGNAPAYGLSSSFTFDQTPPILPADNTDTFVWLRTPTSIQIEVLPATDAITTAANMQYAVYYGTSSSFDTMAQVKAGTLFSTSSSTMRTVTGLSSNTTYYFAVIARDEAGNEVLYPKVAAETAIATSSFTKVDLGIYFGCALNSAQEIFCWGDDANSHLGNGSTAATIADEKNAISSAVVGNLSFTDFDVGDDHVCAIATDSATYCWGLNSNGRLGIGNTTTMDVPTAVSGGYAFVKIAAGATHTCGILASGAAYCWGNNTNYQLGDGTVTQRTTPVPVQGGLTFTDIALGDGYTCGIVSGGSAYCWGFNGNGQLGDNSTAQKTSPTQVSGGLSFTKIHAHGAMTCALTASGTAYCWGYNGYGNLGDGSTTQRTVPTLVSGGLSFTTLSVKNNHVCGLVGTNAHCWGYNNYGQLGDGSTTPRYEPTLVSGELNFSTVAAGTAASCGIVGGNLYCWGNNTSGALGTGGGSASGSNIPVAAMHRPRMTSLGVGFASGCSTDSAGNSYCWGDNNSGNLGDGSTTDRGARKPVATSIRFDRIYGGGYYNQCATSAGSLYCWGANIFRQLGTGPSATGADVYYPVPVASDQRFFKVAMSAGWTGGTYSAFACALSLAGEAYCWGEAGTDGQLGFSAGGNISQPTKVNTTGRFQDISAGHHHACAVNRAGAAYCWGDGGSGQIGDGATSDRATPTLVSGGLTFASISAGFVHTCGVTTAGAGYCWGGNNSYQLGDGTLTTRTVPTAVAGGLTFKKIYAGQYFHSCGITHDDQAYCWGYNPYYQLGDGTATNRTTPTLVAGGHKFRELSLRFDSTCGLRTDGLVMCWGNDTAGLIGNNVTFSASTNAGIPVFVDD